MIAPEAVCWRVVFSGDWFSMSVMIDARDEEEAEKLAAERIKYYYGWDVASVAHDVEVGED